MNNNKEVINPSESKNLKVPENVLIAGHNVYLSKDSFSTGLNNNVLVVGTSGGGKTRYFVKPNIMNAEGSFIVSDPKGNLHTQYEAYLKDKGYDVKKISFIHPESSLRFNPITLCRNTQDIQKLSHALVYGLNGNGSRRTPDPFWDEATQILFNALIGYILENDEIKEKDKNLTTLIKLIPELKRENENSRTECPLKQRFERHKRNYEINKSKESWAYRRFEEFSTAPYKTYQTIIVCSLAKLCSFDTVELREMLKDNDIDFTQIGIKKTALFIEVSDSDRSMDTLVNLFYTCVMNQLCSYADEKCKDSRLPIPVQFILDDFATYARIDNFENMISNNRSRNISASIMVQSEAQLKAGYAESANTIIDNCNTYIFMGTNNPGMASVIAERANKTAQTIINMPVGMQWVFRRGSAPIYCKQFDYEWFCEEKGLTKVIKKQKTKSKNKEKDIIIEDVA